MLRDGYPDSSEWMTSISLHPSREALEDHAAQRQAELDAYGRGGVVSVRGAFWPPREHHGEHKPETARDSGDGEGDTVAVDPDPAGI